MIFYGYVDNGENFIKAKITADTAKEAWGKLEGFSDKVEEQREEFRGAIECLMLRSEAGDEICQTYDDIDAKLAEFDQKHGSLEEKPKDIKDMPVSALSLNTRTYNLLRKHHIEKVGDLIQMPVSKLGEFSGISDGTIRGLAKELMKHNLSFAAEPKKEEVIHDYKKVSSDKYRKKVRRFTLQFGIKDAEAREWFEKQEKQGEPGAYLKRLILEDKARQVGIEESLPFESDEKTNGSKKRSLEEQMADAMARNERRGRESEKVQKKVLKER